MYNGVKRVLILTPRKREIYPFTRNGKGQMFCFTSIIMLLLAKLLDDSGVRSSSRFHM